MKAKTKVVRRKKGEPFVMFLERAADLATWSGSIETDGGFLCAACVTSSGYEDMKAVTVHFNIVTCYNCDGENVRR